MMQHMALIRPATPDDEDAIVELSLLAWEPVFASMIGIVGPALARQLFTDGRADENGRTPTRHRQHRWRHGSCAARDVRTCRFREPPQAQYYLLL
jgi:hypothetical protein